MSRQAPNTPCIGICSTTFGDTVCRGCKRFLHEVVDWNGYSEAQKAIVWRRLDQLLAIVVSNYLHVDDPARLEQGLISQNLRCQPQLSPPARVPELLRAAGQRHPDYASFGIRALPEALGFDGGRALYDTISAEFHALSVAHYERSFQQSVRDLVQRTAAAMLKADQDQDLEQEQEQEQKQEQAG